MKESVYHENEKIKFNHSIYYRLRYDCGIFRLQRSRKRRGNGRYLRSGNNSGFCRQRRYGKGRHTPLPERNNGYGGSTDDTSRSNGIDEINANGGVLGKQITYVLEDGASDAAIFAEKATKLLTSDKVATIFGCWTSASRKAVLPVVEENGGLLWYPVQYEGLESSHNIMYTAPCPNQQAIPAIDYLMENCKGDDGVLKVFLFGSDYVYPRTTNTIIKGMQPDYGFEIVGEEYIPLGYTDCSTVITKIQQTQPDVIINTINGDSNVSFFKQYRDANLSPDKIQVMSFSAYEEDIRGMGAEYAEGTLFAWNYFQTLDTEASKSFTEKFKSLYGSDKVTGDPVVNSYEGVYLWKAAVEAAGTFDIEPVIAQCETGIVEAETPEGEGQMDILWETADRVAPDPWLSSYDWAESAGLAHQ